MTQPRTLLGGLSATQFIQEYWQKKPLLIRQAIPDYVCPLSAEELAGLALEDEVESRLIQQHGDDWQCRYGPFDESDFTSMPDSHWTLLVQNCNRYIPEFAQLLENFDFLPSWRLDDIMVSYAADQGSVGPHWDQYDVFLLQGWGQREWRIIEGDHSNAKLRPGLDLKILSHFDAQHSWLLEPGDMLYLPPGVAHYGIAAGPCITISVGFRAANASQLLNAFCDELLTRQQQQLQQIFYRDNFQNAPSLPQDGLIDELAQQRFSEILQPIVQKQLHNPAWMALALTQSGVPTAALEEPLDPSHLRQRLQLGEYLCRDQASRFAYIKNSKSVILYANGDRFEFDLNLEPLVKLLSGRHFLSYIDIKPYCANERLLELISLGLWYVAGLEEQE